MVNNLNTLFLLVNTLNTLFSLVRVCHDDSDYYSYTEIPIECKGRDGTDYSLVQVNIITNVLQSVIKRVPLAVMVRNYLPV